MIFSTNAFLFLFLPIVLIIYYNPFIKKREFKNSFLVLASLGFYAWGEPVYVILMILSICMNYGFALLIGYFQKKRRIFLIVSLAGNLGILFVFKYLSFIIGMFSKHNMWSLPLPIGISFYTFQAISYVMDVYHGVKAEKKLLNVALYISFFPQLIAGPIVRYKQIAKEIQNRDESFRNFRKGVDRFIIGLAKKVILANNIARIADESFRCIGSMSIATAWLGAISYTLQIYFDFSGYSDMAIGLGRMFGFHISTNFKYPYISKSVTEFWRRWHISLSRWFRDYVYFSLGGGKCSKLRNIINLGIVWLLTGIWHGANWTFLLWGISYFIVLVFEKNIKWTCNKKYFNYVYTVIVVILLWVLFRAESISQAAAYIENMFRISKYGFLDNRFCQIIMHYKVYIVAGLLGSFPVSLWMYRHLSKRDYYKIWGTLATVGKILIFLITITFMAADTYNPFIYFNF